MLCDYGFVYMACGPPCPVTCDSLLPFWLVSSMQQLILFSDLQRCCVTMALFTWHVGLPARLLAIPSVVKQTVSFVKDVQKAAIAHLEK